MLLSPATSLSRPPPPQPGTGRHAISRQLINEYRAELDRLRAVIGSTRETNLRPAFARLLRAWGKAAHDLVFVEEHQLRAGAGNLISVDGALLHSLRVPFGYWEAKDERDDLEAEIAAKFRRGYPRDNIMFTDDRTAVLYQDGARAGEPFQALAGQHPFGLDALEKTKCLPRYRHTKSGERVDNITDWALQRFREHYLVTPGLTRGPAFSGAGEGSGTPAQGRGDESDWGDGSEKLGVHSEITKDLIFAYTYAVLHDPVYRETYALNLKREFPRIPFYPDFARWAAWGERLLALHIGYEQAEPFPFTRVDTPNPKRATGTAPKPKLKSYPDQGLVVVDEDTQLTGIPPVAWSYRLGNRSAIDWVLDQHKEKRPRDPTVAAKFNTYRFADHKEAMIELLARVVTVSLETVAITDAMRALDRGAAGA